jgi:heme-degrading monooxygenase HmoA
VILLVWRAEISPGRSEEYRRFEWERCLPMFRLQPGFVGVLFLRQTEDHTVSLSVWEDRGAVEALDSSPSYRRTARELAKRRLLEGGHSVEVLEVGGGELRPEAFMGALGRTRCADLPDSSVASSGSQNGP